MDRREAILRELNLYPQWKRRDAPAPAPLAAEPDAAIKQEAPVPATAAGSMQKADIPTLAVQQHAKAEAIQAPAVTPHSDVAGLDWSALKQRVSACSACKLRAGCTQTVFGVGDEHADWLFVGEGPGADEDALGEPFVGQAGKLLDNMLIAIKLKRGNNVYIANIVKCRPPGNRNPDAEEIAACLPYLQRQIELLQPKMIVALGKVASNALLGRDATLASLRGKLHDYRGIPLIVTYHPAYLLRSPSEKAKAWQDLCVAQNKMHESEQPTEKK
ncbi:MAG TPA: uracil-DNA glycosylase [Gallionella sp.]|nr:uracil-DNA glycosylase [Gallionella sp.]